MKKIIISFGFVCLFACFKHSLVLSETTSNQSIKQLYLQHQVEEEGRRLAEQGYLNEALEKFNEALEPKYIKYEFDKFSARGSIIKILIWQRKYDEVLEKYQNWYLNKNDIPELALDNRDQILALKKFETTKDPDPVYEYIQMIRIKYKNEFPPLGYDSGTGVSRIATILRLYNVVGDHDAGIAFIEEILNWAYDTDKEFQHLKGKINNSEESGQCMELDKPVKQRNPDSLACKWLRAYLLVREAFEQDKAEGFQGCAGKKPGEVCMGRATKALIQSDYFPW